MDWALIARALPTEPLGCPRHSIQYLVTIVFQAGVEPPSDCTTLWNVHCFYTLVCIPCNKSQSMERKTSYVIVGKCPLGRNSVGWRRTMRENTTARPRTTLATPSALRRRWKSVSGPTPIPLGVRTWWSSVTSFPPTQTRCAGACAGSV